MNTRIADELTCLVCSDKAMGNNFGAISCESCKAFFRRNAHDIEKLRCEFTGKCTITILTRRHCRRCRLEKCFQVGMRKDWILTVEQLQIRRARIQSRKCRELATRSNLSSSSSSLTSSSLPNHHHHHHVITPSSPSSSSSPACANVEQLSSIISSRDLPHAHHHQRQQHPIAHNSTPIIGSISFCHNDGLSSSNASGSGDVEEEDENGEDEESDNDYTESSDRMERKLIDISFSHNMLTSLLDDNSHENQQQSINDLYSSSPVTFGSSTNHFYSDFEQTSPSPMAQNVPSFLSTSQQSEIHHNHNESNSSQHDSSLIVPSNSPSSSQLTCSPLNPFSSSSSSLSSHHHHHHHHQHLQDPMISQFPYDNRLSSTSSSSSSNLFLTNFSTKSEPGDYNSIENEIAQSKIDDLIMGSDLNLPINLSNEYITSNFSLNQLLNQRMNELIHSYSTITYQPLPTNCEILTTTTPTLQETVIQLIDYIAKSLITSTKSLTPFSRLPLQVRNDMFKESFSNLITIRLCFLFDLDKGGWKAPGPSSKLIKYNFLKLDSQSASYFLDFIKDLNERRQKDLQIGLILEAITLFSLNNINMKHQENISKEKYIYTYLLRHYLESLGLSVGQARADCYDLLMKLETIKINIKPLDKIRQICSYQPLKAGQLLSEILDLV